MIVLFALAILSLSFQNVAFKLFNMNYMKNTASYFIFNAVYFTMICVIYAVIGINFINFMPAVVLLGTLFACSFISAMYLYMKAMENGPLGLSFLFFSSGMLLPILFGIIFFREPAPFHKFIGLILLFAAFYISTIGAGSNKMNKKWVVYILLAAVSNGIIGIAIRLVRTVVPEDAFVDFLFLGFGQAAVLSFIIGVFVIMRYKPTMTHLYAAPFILIAVLAAVTTAGGNYAMVTLSLYVSALVQFPIVNGSLVISSIIASRVLFKEKVTKQHILTIAVGLAAILLLSL